MPCLITTGVNGSECARLNPAQTMMMPRSELMRLLLSALTRRMICWKISLASGDDERAAAERTALPTRQPPQRRAVPRVVALVTVLMENPNGAVLPPPSQ